MRAFWQRVNGSGLTEQINNWNKGQGREWLFIRTHSVYLSTVSGADSCVLPGLHRDPKKAFSLSRMIIIIKKILQRVGYCGGITENNSSQVLPGFLFLVVH